RCGRARGVLATAARCARILHGPDPRRAGPGAVGCAAGTLAQTTRLGGRSDAGTPWGSHDESGCGICSSPHAGDQHVIRRALATITAVSAPDRKRTWCSELRAPDNLQLQ